MKCPKCGREMEPGFVQGGKRIYFNAEPVRHPDGKRRDSVPIESTRHFFTPHTSPAYHCPWCEIVAIDRTDPRYREE